MQHTQNYSYPTKDGEVTLYLKKIPNIILCVLDILLINFKLNGTNVNSIPVVIALMCKTLYFAVHVNWIVLVLNKMKGSSRFIFAVSWITFRLFLMLNARVSNGEYYYCLD